MKLSQLKGLLFIFGLLFYACSNVDQPLTDLDLETDNNILPRLTEDLQMEKIPIFNYSEQRVDKMEYHITQTNQTETITREYDVQEILDNVSTYGYLWKVIEDVRFYEIQEFGTTRVTSNHVSFIDQTNDAADALLVGEKCNENTTIVGSGAITAIEYFISMAEDDPFILYGGENCIEDSPYYELWLLLGTFSPSQTVIDNIKEIWDDSSIQALYNASTGGATNLDFHSVKICDLPGQMDPKAFFELLRSKFYVDPFDTECGTDFELYEEFSDSEWMTSPLSTLFEIDLVPVVESGDVVCSYFDNTNIIDVNTEYLGYRWIFTTIYGRESGWHPVSGNRQFGLYPDGDGCWNFYTAGVDKQTNWYHVMFGGETAFGIADALWDCIVNQVSDLVVEMGGTTSGTTSVYCRPDLTDLLVTWSSYCYNPPYFEMFPPCTECQ